MQIDIITILLYAGSVAWFATAIVYKDGPYKIFAKTKALINNLLGKQLSPTECAFCIGPWLLVILAAVGYFVPSVITFFGILGIGAALRGMSQEYG